MLPDIQPGNTKILYFFNCLLDGMHTKIKHICDFSRCRLNVRVKALASNLCSEATNMLYLSYRGLCLARDGIAIYCWRDLRTLQKVIAFVVTVF